MDAVASLLIFSGCSFDSGGVYTRLSLVTPPTTLRGAYYMLIPGLLVRSCYNWPELSSVDLDRALTRNSLSETAPSEAILVKINIKINTLPAPWNGVLKIINARSTDKNSKSKSTSIMCFINPVKHLTETTTQSIQGFTISSQINVVNISVNAKMCKIY